ncbi:MAG: iron transporter [Nitrolancea sp.]
MASEHQSHDTSMPPMVPSMEATKEQLQRAKEQGDVYGNALAAMQEETGQLAVERAGDYEIGATVEEAEGLYQLENNEFRWISPEGENAHLEIVVRDAADGRFIPGLDVRATLFTSDGKEVGTHQMPFLWHPMLYHYGLDWKIPAEGDYRVHVRVEPPTFMRHDYKNGKRYGKPEEVDLTLHITPGQKFVKGKEDQVR